MNDGDFYNSQRELGYVGHWSINYDPEDPGQLCLWKRKKPFFLHRVMNWYLLGNKWIDLK